MPSAQGLWFGDGFRSDAMLLPAVVLACTLEA
jgi:hypothetical protein